MEAHTHSDWVEDPSYDMLRKVRQAVYNSIKRSGLSQGREVMEKLDADVFGNWRDLW